MKLKRQDDNIMKADLIIKNGLIVSVDSCDTIYENGSIAVIDNKIAAIGTNASIEKHYTSSSTIDATDKIVMPGLINTHTHLPMTIFRGIADDLVLSEWLEKYIFPAEQKYVNPQLVSLGSRLAMAEMIKGGTTCFNDMYYFQDATGEVASEMGVRGIISESFIDFPVANSKSPEECLEYTKKLIEKYKTNTLVDVGIATHSTYTCSPNVLLLAKELADEHNLNFQIHVSESRWEVETVTQKYGVNPVQHLEKLGILDEKVIAAHCVWLDEEDIKTFVKRKVGITHNPSCNMKISSGAAPVPKFLKAGLNVGIGTDGAASNNNLNMIKEMRTMALLHKLSTLSPTVATAREVVRVATINGAKILRKDHEIGSLEKGKKADIILIDTSSPNVTPIYDAYSAIVYSLLGSEVSDVIIDGKIIMKNQKLTLSDETEIINSAREQAAKIAKDIKR